jgi:uncharacterized protein YciI
MLFAVKVYDIENSTELRNIHRQRHLDYIASFENQIMFAGPILTDDLKYELGSHRLIDLPDRTAVEQHVANEPYVIAGAQYGPEIHPWSASAPYTWKDCPRIEENVQFLIHAIDKPDSDALRSGLRGEHEAYQTSVEDLYITRGPLLSDSGERQIGSLMIIDVADLSAAKSFWMNEPFTKGGLFDRVEFYGWRFGRVFDKYKI